MAVLMVRLQGDRAALQLIEAIHQGARVAGQFRARIGSNLVYAYGIEFGRHRGGKLARRAGGLLYLTRAVQEVRRTLPAALARALLGGTAEVRQTLRAQAYRVEARAKTYETAVRTGTLRRSIHTVIEE